MDKKFEQWKKWDHEGFIPGPNESEQEYVERVMFCQNLEQHLFDQKNLPFEVCNQKGKNLFEEAFPLTETLYSIRPNWVPLIFHNHQLAPWHGGCAWIFKINDETPTAAFLQLRSQFLCSPSFLKLYKRKELIAHELAHVGRMLYQEPQFEEILAYQTSSSKWQRWLGPIVQSSKETLFFLFILVVILFGEVSFIFSQTEFTRTISGWLFLIPFFIFGLALIRLYYRNQIFKKCLGNLNKIYPLSTARHLIYRLRDNEIKEFALWSTAKIKEFIEDSEHTTFRWRFLKTHVTEGKKNGN